MQEIDPIDSEVLLSHLETMDKLLRSSDPRKKEYAYQIMIRSGISLIKEIEENSEAWRFSSLGSALLSIARKARSSFFQYEERRQKI